MDIETLMNTYSQKLLRYATSILYNHQDAEDIVQDVFLTAFEQIHRFKGDNISPWLYKITYNKSINKLRRDKFLLFGKIPEDSVTLTYFGEEAEVIKSLKLLKPQDRALVYARVVEGYSYDELAVQMDKTPANLRKRYERAKKKLSETLTERGESS